MISCPTEIFVSNPCPTVIGIGPVAISIRTPVRIINGHIGLPAIAVVCNLDPIPTRQIIVEEINAYILCLDWLPRRQPKGKYR
jgi:hypothetical protein